MFWFGCDSPNFLNTSKVKFDWSKNPVLPWDPFPKKRLHRGNFSPKAILYLYCLPQCNASCISKNSPRKIIQINSIQPPSANNEDNNDLRLSQQQWEERGLDESICTDTCKYLGIDPLPEFQ